MKKVLSYILITVIMLANFLAPISVGWGNKNVPVVEKNKVEAVTTVGENVKITVNPKPDGKLGINVNGTFVIDKEINSARVAYSIGKDPNNFLKNIVTNEKLNLSSMNKSDKVFVYNFGKQLYQYSDGTTTLKDVVKDETYYALVSITSPDPNPIDVYLSQPIFFTAGKVSDQDAPGGGESEINAGNAYENAIASGKTTTEATAEALAAGTQNKDVAINKIVKMPSCGPAFWNTLDGCFAQLLYAVLFKPTSWAFSKSGELMDYTFFYSVQSDSYESQFVVEGWNIVRDFCNMFFIFVLLYIAFGTILNLHGVKTKEMIINVVIIGLLINFSLFATRVIIDASNILARTFYVPGVSTLATPESGVIPMSEEIVNKVDPQTLIIDGAKVGEIPDKTGLTENSSSGKTISTGTFILVTILAIIINIIGIIVFLSVGILFITRVVGLWVAMILAPFAFFSYTVPAMQDWGMVGWKKWWPETLKLAFLAPVFIFFMYIILQFVDKGLGTVKTAVGGGAVDFVLSVIIPYAFIMILLWKAKDIATKMSGEMGQAITKGVKVAGGLALGGAALGAAALGRSTIGSIAKYTQNDTARKNDLKFKGVKDKWSTMNKLNPLNYFGLAGKAISSTGKAATAGIATGLAQVGKKTNPTTGKTTNYFQRQERDFGNKAHAQHTIDEMSGKKFDGAKYKELREDQQTKVRTEVNKDELARAMTGAGFDSIKDDALKSYINTRAKNYTDGGEVGPLDGTYTDPTGKVISGKVDHSALEMVGFTQANQVMGEFLSAVRKGSYDLRNISKLKSSNKGLPMMAIGLAAIVASGVRTGLKSGVGVEHGTGQKEFFKDLSSTVSEALKGMKIDVKIDESGKAHSTSGGHGGGHH